VVVCRQPDNGIIFIISGVSAMDIEKKKTTISLWTIDAMFSVRIKLATFITVKEPGKVWLQPRLVTAPGSYSHG